VTIGSTIAVVVPTIGRSSLWPLVERLREEVDARIVVVDDRLAGAPLDVGGLAEVRRSGGAGPAAARNVGWRAVEAPWVVFVDDDVLPLPGWATLLAQDLAAADPDLAAVQGRIEVPLPRGRRATDWERNVSALASARWITADLAVRRSALVATGGFHEGFRRAYREDTDLALRLQAAGWRLELGDRRVRHPVRPAPWHVSVGRQRGNADDALMSRRHGRGWRRGAGLPRGALRSHLITTTSLAVALVLLLLQRPRPAGAAGVAWTAGTARFAWSRIRPGPRTASEVAAMVVTSVAIPPVAVWHRARGEVAAVLFDRDGTLVHDVPYNGDPDRVVPVPGARAALDRLRRAGLAIGLVTNQSGIGRGTLRLDEVAAVNRRVAELVGRFDVVAVCPHADDDRCGCRKPGPGLVRAAAAAVGVPADRCVVVGDIGTDVQAARSAGARAVLVPNAATRPAEVAMANQLEGEDGGGTGPAVAVRPDLRAAVDLILSRWAR
jgi:histidinol-phosphate phosphatase family protein